MVCRSGTRMLNCHRVTQLISESQERGLSVSERVSLKFHTMMCAGCRNFNEQVPLLRKLMREYRDAKPPES